MFDQVAVDDDTQLLALIAQYKKLRTYPEARDTAQRRLHERLTQLHANGSVTLVATDANTCLWETR